MSSKEFTLLMRFILDCCERKDLDTLEKIVRETLEEDK